MRRQDIQLLTLARQGDPAARSKAGRRYLVGGDGFPRHVATGIEYLSHPSVRELPETACAIAESLPLQDLLDLKQEDALHKAAAAGSPLAQFKLGVWMALTRSSVTAGQSWLETAAAAGHVEACQVMAAVEGARSDRALEAMVESIQSSAAVDVVQVAVIAARQAREAGGLDQLVDCLRVALMVAPRLTHALSDLVVAAVLWAEREKHSLRGLAPDQIEASLELAVVRGDRDAACLLGRARCGIDSGTLAPARLATSLNLRKGVALLLRAADAGRDDAWLALYATHADHRSSVSNPQMARFFLEKAAMAGQSEAQRKLGARTADRRRRMLQILGRIAIAPVAVLSPGRTRVDVRIEHATRHHLPASTVRTDDVTLRLRRFGFDALIVHEDARLSTHRTAQRHDGARGRFGSHCSPPK